MIHLTFKHNFHLLESTLLTLAEEFKGNATKAALTTTAAAARRDIMEKLPAVFDRPTRFTLNSIRYMPARDLSGEAEPRGLQASVYISDDAPKGVSPRRYLGPEIAGGVRGFKRSERALAAKGMMRPDQQWVPGSAAQLDQFGNLPGPAMVRILSRLSAFGEQGYSANLSLATRKHLARLGQAVRATGADVFIAHSKRDGAPLGVWQLQSRGVVRPLLIFTDRRPTYHPRFGFHDLVAESAAAHWPGEMMKAFYRALERRA